MLYIFRRYLYLGTSSSTVLFCVIMLSWSVPILTTLHFAAPNSIWYFLATWFVMSIISCRVVRSWWMRHTSSIHSRVFSWIPCFVCKPILFFFSSLAIRAAYSITNRTPPCLMLSLIFISLVCPCLVWILALRFEFSFLINGRFLPLTPFLCSACSIPSSHALSKAF